MKRYTLLLMLLMASVFAFAQPASYLTFNGTDQYMMIPHHDDFNITTSENFTLTGWVKIANYGSNDPRYISKRENGSASGDARTGYEYFGQSSTYKFGLNTPTNTTGHAYSTYTGVYVYPNTWMHFALVVDHDNDVIRIYQDGTNVNTSTNSTLVSTWYVNNTNNVYIGAGYNAGNVQYLLNGAMGNVRFYSKALSSSEISTDMNNSPIANLTQDMRDNLIAAYEMSTSNIHSGQISDLSGNGHTATVFGYTSGDPEITGVTLTQQTGYTGRGNDNELILKAAVAFGGTNANVNLSKVKLNINGTSASDYDNIKVYSTGSTATFNASTATHLGTVTPTSGDFDCALSGALNSGTNYLWITADVKATATEGNKIDASLVSITTDEQTYEVTSPSPSGDREILLARTTLYKPGDYSSQFWRIPAVITAKDGSIVAVTDKRKYSNGDLPQDIDIVARRSTDGGLTWSAPVTIAQGTGYNQGYGDCALVLGDGDGEIIAGFVGGVGLWNGTNTNPLRHYISRSLDNGQTWSTPVDITNQLYGSGCSVSPNNTWHSSFFGSGNGLRTTSGRIMFVAAIRHTLYNGAGNSETLYNHAIYSDDNGVTWHVSGQASTGGDEAKVTQLNDGRILMSIRHSGNRWYNISNDNGETWGSTQSWSDLYNQNACNGDMIRYTSISQGYEKNRLLHSFPDYSNGRRDVSVFVSYNEGTSWPTKKCIVPYSSAYSSLCILPDGTIGLYVEEDVDGGDTYDCVFYNFSLSWMTGGADVYVPIGEMHGINYLTCEHGSVSGMTQAPENAIVTVTATPDSGYELCNITVTKVGGGNVTVTGNQFTMPAEEVNVSATFTAADVELIVGNEGPNSGSTKWYPIHASNANTLTEFIYQKDNFEELTQSGPVTIKGLSFKTSSNNSATQTWSNVKVYITTTDKTKFSSKTDHISVNGCLVYTGNIEVTQTGENWTTTMDFDTPFEYDGEDNLVVTIFGGSNINSNSVMFKNFGGTDYQWGIQHVVGSGDPETFTPSGNGSYCSWITVAKFIFGEPPTQYDINYLSCTNGSVSGPAKAAEGHLVTVTATPDSGYELSNIVVTKVAGGNVAVTGNQFTMPAEAVNVSATFVVNPIQTFLDEGFENNGTSLPVGWTQVYESGTHNWVVKSGIYSSHSATAHTGSYNAAFVHNNYYEKTKLVTPVMNLSSCANATLTFWFIKPEWYGDNDQLRVYYRTSSTGSWTLIEGCEFTTGVSSWTKVEKALPNLTETYQIAFEGYDGYGYGIGVDDVKIIGTVVPTYQISYTDDGNGTVTGPAKAAEGANVALTVTPNHGYELNEITVTKVGGGDIEVIDNHFTMPAEAVNVSATFSVLTPVTLTITTFGQGTMTASPSPDVYAGDEVTLTATPAAGYMLGRLVVRKDATGEEITVTNNKFTMPAENVTVYASFYEGFEFFEDFETNPTAKGWTYASSGSGNWQWATGGHSGKCVYCSWSAAESEPYIVTPALNLEGMEGVTMTFWRQQPNYNGKCEELNVKYTLDNGANWNLIANYNTVTSGYVETTIAIPAAACANGVKFGFQAIYHDAYSVYIDDVRIFKDIVLPSYSITPDITGSGTLSFSPEGNVEVGTTVTVTANGTALTSLSYLREDGRTIDIDIENTPYTFTMPECNTTVTAVFEAAVPCTVTAHVNGVTFFTEDNAYVGGDFTLPEIMTYDGYTFMGWNIDNPTPGSSVDIPASASTFKPTGDCDIYAVYGIAEIGDEYTLMSTPSFEDGMKYIISMYYDDYYAIDLTESTVGGNVTMTRVVEDSPGVITSTSMTDLALTAVYSNEYSGYCLTDGVNRVYDGDPYQVRAGATSTWNGDAYVIDTYETHTYIRSNQYNYGVYYWMSLYWSSTSPTGFIFGTNNYGGSELRIYKASMAYTYYTEFDAPIISNTEIAGTASLSRAVTIGSNGVLSFTGTFTNATASDLTIQDGGQLIINNSGVMATVEKDITAASSWTGDATDGWYTISSPINSNALDINSIDNFTDDSFDLYYYNEPTHYWINSDGGTAYNALANTRGYLYAASSTRTLGFAGELNNADVNCSLSYTSTLDVAGLRGFNLIGNPFTQNITMSNISGAALPGGYVLTNAGAWKAEVDTEIKPCEGFLVQTNTATEITISKGAAKSRDKHCYITANVKHGEYEDNAFAMFSETTGLNKISHRNSDVPMLYIPQNDEKFAIAVMDESVTVFPLNFKATTTGYYTISLKSSQIYEGYNDFDYLHLIDNMTGEDIDMLLEGSYSFIGSPRDNDSRFTVKLHRDGVEENEAGNENFVYQNGSELIVNGEGTFQLIDMLGRVVISKEVHGESVSIDGLMTGAYIVRMMSDEVKTQKIVIR